MTILPFIGYKMWVYLFGSFDLKLLIFNLLTLDTKLETLATKLELVIKD